MPGRGTEKQRGLLNEFSRSSVNGDGEAVEKLTPLNTVNYAVLMGDFLQQQ